MDAVWGQVGPKCDPPVTNFFFRCATQNEKLSCSVIDELKEGKLMGEDEYGNKYYQNNYYFFSSNRWVRYNPNTNMEYDGSQVPPEWHRWLHYITDETPTSKPPEKRKWMQPHTPNLSGTTKKYVPYSTTKPKIESWQPDQK